MMGMRNENDESLLDPDSPVGKQYNNIMDTLNTEGGTYVFIYASLFCNDDSV
jgi:hypothetical protein